MGNYTHFLVMGIKLISGLKRWISPIFLRINPPKAKNVYRIKIFFQQNRYLSVCKTTDRRRYLA